ncbi:MAG: T9SS type A sorting domain-containing protein [Flammeovirgaceae bacterium]
MIDAPYDVATHGDITSNNLTINVGETLTMASGNINLTGYFENNGNAFAQTGGTVTFNGSSAQTIEGTNSFHQLTINNASGVTLNSATSVTGVLTLTAGTLASGGNLTLASTSVVAGGTATVDFSGSGSISGNVTQQRFLDGATQNGWRYVATGVAGQTLAAIDDDIALTQLGSVFSPGTNESIYTNFYNPHPNLFYYDQSLVKSGTISAGHLNGQSFDNAEIGWEIPAATSDVFNSGSGVALQVSASDVTLDFTGTLQHTDVVLSLAHGGQTNSGWHLIGNPFAATLDWNAVYDDAGNSGVDPTAYVFDATTDYSGTYSGYNAATNASVNGGSKDIASGQGFFIQTTSGMTGDVTLKTSHTSSTDVQFYRIHERAEWQGELRLKLADEQGHEDELLLYLIDDAQEGQDLGDAKKFFGTAHGLPEIASKAFDFPLMMDCRAPLENEETESFQLALKGGATGTFTLKITTIAQFELGTEIFLEDRLTQQMIALQEGMEYDIEIANAHEIIDDLFWIHMRLNRVTSMQDDFVSHGVSLFLQNKQVHIQFADASVAKSKVAIYDLMGRVIYQQTNVTELNLSFPIDRSGVYVVKVENQHGAISQKVIIE